MLGFIKRKLHKHIRYKKWRRINQNNLTAPLNDFDMSKVYVGNHTYGEIFVSNYNINERLEIGHFCSIGPEVAFLLNSDHPTNLVSSYPFKVQTLKTEKFEAVSKGDIIVDDDVWIGYRATILSGVHIGQGAVVAAGAVVTKDVPPYAIVGGVPAKVIKYRFSKPVIDVLMTIDYSRLDKNMIEKHIADLYEPIDEMNVEEVTQVIAWMPKKHH